jgi:hypothetical protein
MEQERTPKQLEKFRESERLCVRKWYQEHKAGKLAYSKQYYQEHKEAIQNHNKQYFQEHREAYKAYNKEYRQKNKDRISERQRARYKEAGPRAKWKRAYETI